MSEGKPVYLACFGRNTKICYEDLKVAYREKRKAQDTGTG